MSKQEGFNHSPEPWYAGRPDGSNGFWYIGPKKHTDENHGITVYPFNGDQIAEANAKRIVACVNACAGVKNPEPLHKVIQCLKYIKANWYVSTSGVKEVSDSILITFPGGKLE